MSPSDRLHSHARSIQSDMDKVMSCIESGKPVPSILVRKLVGQQSLIGRYNCALAQGRENQSPS